MTAPPARAIPSRLPTAATARVAPARAATRAAPTAAHAASRPAAATACVARRRTAATVRAIADLAARPPASVGADRADPARARAATAAAVLVKAVGVKAKAAGAKAVGARAAGARAAASPRCAATCGVTRPRRHRAARRIARAAAPAPMIRVKPAPRCHRPAIRARRSSAGSIRSVVSRVGTAPASTRQLSCAAAFDALHVARIHRSSATSSAHREHRTHRPTPSRAVIFPNARPQQPAITPNHHPTTRPHRQPTLPKQQRNSPHHRQKLAHPTSAPAPTLAISPAWTNFRAPEATLRDGSGRSAVWLAHLTGGQGVGSSNLLAPTERGTVKTVPFAFCVACTSVAPSG